MAQTIIYYGIFINKESKNKLKSLVPRTAYKVYCDHMTLAHSSTFTDEVVNICNGLLGKEFTITATTIGKSKDAIAVGIETDCFSVNDHKHITLCTMTPSSKPVQSNYIENWVKLKKPIILKGTVMAFTNNGLVKENKTMERKLIRLTESDLHRIVKESVNGIIAEMNYKTYANAAKKRYQQWKDEKDPEKREKLYNSYWDLKNMAKETFDNEFIGLMKYDTFGDRVKGKHSPKFDVSDVIDNPYGALNGYNKGGNKMFSTGKGKYYQSSGGNMSPRQFFRNGEVADKYINANDELWDYYNGEYDYDSIKDGGEGKWKKKTKSM